MISLDNLKTTINAIKCLLTDYPKKKDIPTKLPNPNPLTFTGAVIDSYDGSETLAVEIPSVTKPLTYDYMPEGYPKKSVQTITLMEEQEVAFAESGGAYVSVLTDALNLVEGQTYTVNWDGTEYECVSRKFNNILVIGNLSIFGLSENSGEPFLYVMSGKAFTTLDTSPSHTISVKTTGEVATQMAGEFIPTIPADKLPSFPFVTLNERLADTIANSSPPHYNFTNLTYDELYNAVSKGRILIRDTLTETYMPLWSDITNGHIFLDIIIRSSSELYYVNLCCSNGETYFFRNDIKKIATSDI